MKKGLYFLCILGLLTGCSREQFNNENPFLPNYAFSMSLDTNLANYNPLLFAGNSIRVFPVNGPANGVIVFYTGAQYNAFDGSCPNQNITSCSRLTLSGSNAQCECEGENYNLFTGQAPNKPYSLKLYRVQVAGNVITVFN
ncbi:Ferredoxin subunit of nitrite reductase or a ring-hydroxylating dioxygenase [Flavobacterium fontis]|jgi:nitrite reductase/ring-hydroxylating ferredoxin subunit|uniref:Ferredoxin subunit of nitrite reductase or a ring-hydroxylating dioxygenase n=1 Tax=Flavobacterium fontis TaxID=1124188 RepID=A0A1M4YSE6_9FLAO|nr:MULTISPECIES: hypothetical protein [Flavobacterium]MCZ8168267.1 hypothetical protein [Flavobacterium sp.]MCZ8296919.1 hypothetical protein [Flavobacterium sp.]SHF08651.1 Ferredoxin subunit of nitrite reductase or a ring-hydroxylating dioxygenase [Flavobacterium fontis]